MARVMHMKPTTSQTTTATCNNNLNIKVIPAAAGVVPPSSLGGKHFRIRKKKYRKIVLSSPSKKKSKNRTSQPMPAFSKVVRHENRANHESKPQVLNGLKHNHNHNHHDEDQMLMKNLARDLSSLPQYTPPKDGVLLAARQVSLHDMAFRRRYLVESRPRIELLRYHTGDLVWAKMKGWPWWPAMVSVHPQRDEFYRYHLDGASISFHLQFFGPVAFHGWINECFTQPFEGFAAFHRKMMGNIEAASSSVRPEKRAKVVENYAVSAGQAPKLNQAIGEAEQALKMTPQVRLHELTYMYFSRKYNKFCI